MERWMARSSPASHGKWPRISVKKNKRSPGHLALAQSLLTPVGGGGRKEDALTYNDVWWVLSRVLKPLSPLGLRLLLLALAWEPLRADPRRIFWRWSMKLQGMNYKLVKGEWMDGFHCKQLGFNPAGNPLGSCRMHLWVLYWAMGKPRYLYTDSLLTG